MIELLFLAYYSSESFSACCSVNFVNVFNAFSTFCTSFFKYSNGKGELSCIHVYMVYLHMIRANKA